jgi:hypothetical protein
MIESFQSLSTGLLAGAIVYAGSGALTALFVHFRNRRGWLTGEWTEIIQAVGDRPEREDNVFCSHRGDNDTVTAKIVRDKPRDNLQKQWTFTGALRQDTLVGYFLGVVGNSDSYGVIFMRKRDSNTFSGHYSKLLNLSEVDQRELLGHKPLTEVLRPEGIPLEWRRKSRSSWFADFITSILKFWRIVVHPHKSRDSTSPEKADRT